MIYIQEWTVNERLYHSGNFKAFDSAVKNKKIDKKIAILKEIELGEESIKAILKHYNLNQ